MAEQSIADHGAPGQSISDEAREAVFRAIVATAAKLSNSPAGLRDLAEAYALLTGSLAPNVGVVHNKT